MTVTDVCLIVIAATQVVKIYLKLRPAEVRPTRPGTVWQDKIKH